MGIGVRAALWFAGAALGMIMPLRAQAPTESVASLPRPTGQYPVGTVVNYLNDGTRRDSVFPTGRPINLQLWYPAAHASEHPAPYFPEPGLRPALEHYGYYDMSAATFAAWSALATHSSLDAPPTAGRHPLLAFSVGLGMIRANYTSLAEELASHGYIVALVESPLQGMLVRPDGMVVTDTIGLFESAAAHRRAVSGWAGDIAYTLDALLGRTVPPALARIASHIDSDRIGAIGHSSGGLVAVQACELDPRITACVDMDGGLADPEGAFLADFAAAHLTTPTLFLRSQPLYDDTTFARRGITREEWTRRGEAGQKAFDAFTAKSPSLVTVAAVAGTGHLSFSDVPFVMPTGISRFGGRIIAADRGWLAITTVLRGFFAEVFEGRIGSLQQAAGRFPEVALTVPTRQ